MLHSVLHGVAVVILAKPCCEVVSIIIISITCVWFSFLLVHLSGSYLLNVRPRLQMWSIPATPTPVAKLSLKDFSSAAGICSLMFSGVFSSMASSGVTLLDEAPFIVFPYRIIVCAKSCATEGLSVQPLLFWFPNWFTPLLINKRENVWFDQLKYEEAWTQLNLQWCAGLCVNMWLFVYMRVSLCVCVRVCVYARALVRASFCFVCAC